MLNTQTDKVTYSIDHGCKGLNDERCSHDNEEIAFWKILINGGEKAPGKMLAEEDNVRFSHLIAGVTARKFFSHHLKRRESRKGSGEEIKMEKKGEGGQRKE